MKHNIIVNTGTGKLGNNVFYVRGGLQMARIYQPVVANPRTRPQLQAREKFALLSDIAGKMGCIVKMGLMPWKDSRISQQNKFIELNKNTINSSMEPEYDAMVVAKGTLTPVYWGSANFATPMKVIVPIDASNIEACDASADDDVYVGVYCEELGMAISPVSGKRGDPSITVDVPSNWQGNKVYVWGWVKNAEGKTSDSFFCGSGTIS